MLDERRRAGDYVRAADALGDLSAEDTRSAEVPDFRETVLWFHALPDDESHVAAAKVRRLRRAGEALSWTPPEPASGMASQRRSSSCLCGCLGVR